MKLIAFPLLALAAAACAMPGALVGRSESDLRAQLGTPAGEYRNSDGSRTLAYPQGAFAGQTYMAEIAPGGAVRSVQQALTDDTIMNINPGLTREQVLRMIGPPRDMMEFPRKREISWEYYFTDTWGYRSYLFVNFDQSGIVVSRTTRRIERDAPFR